MDKNSIRQLLEQVKQGDLLARLDPADFRVAVASAQAQYDLALAQYNRAAELVERQLIAQADYEKNEAMKSRRIRRVAIRLGHTDTRRRALCRILGNISLWQIRPQSTRESSVEQLALKAWIGRAGVWL